MKKSLLLLTLLVSLTSCQNKTNGSNNKENSSNNQTLTKQQAYSILNSNYHVEAKVSKTINLPEQYASLSTTKTYSISRDYGYLQKNDKKHTAVTDYANNKKVTYYEADDGKITSDYYNYKNEVISNTVGLSLLTYEFNKIYKNPFDYITIDDINDDLSLTNNKANLLLEQYFSLNVNVSEAKFIIDNNTISGLDLTIPDKIGGITISNTNYNITTSYKTSFKFNFENITFNEIAPSSNSNAELKSAFEDLKDNFTLVLSSSSASSAVVYYVTDNGILYKQNYNYYGLQQGDIYYKKSGDSYSIYTYSPSPIADFVLSGSTKYENILPDLTKVSDALFTKSSSNIYTLVDEAKTYVPTYFAPYNYKLSDDSGLDGYIKLNEENKISLISMSYLYSGNIVTYNENILNQGKTSFPTYFDENSSDFEI